MKYCSGEGKRTRTNLEMAIYCIIYLGHNFILCFKANILCILLCCHDVVFKLLLVLLVSTYF